MTKPIFTKEGGEKGYHVNDISFDYSLNRFIIHIHTENDGIMSINGIGEADFVGLINIMTNILWKIKKDDDEQINMEKSDERITMREEEGERK